MMQCLIADFAKDRVHHDEQAQSYGDGDTDELALLKCRPCLFDEVSQENADDHGKEDPYGKKAVQPTQSFDHRTLLHCYLLLELQTFEGSILDMCGWRSASGLRPFNRRQSHDVCRHAVRDVVARVFEALGFFRREPR